MKPSDFQKIVQCRFESCLKKVVRHVVKDYQQGLKQRKDKEIPFCELPEIVVEKLAVRDEYDSDYTFFNVCGNDIRICDDELAEALKHLSERNRENLLMYYFLKLSDTEITKKTKHFKKWCFSKPTQFIRAFVLVFPPQIGQWIQREFFRLSFTLYTSNNGIAPR